jgi:hypothetical protein
MKANGLHSLPCNQHTKEVTLNEETQRNDDAPLARGREGKASRLCRGG